MSTSLAEVLAKITPLPWAVSRWDYKKGEEVRTHIEAGSDVVATVVDLWCMDERSAERDANAAYLAHAANVLPGLVRAADLLASTADGLRAFEDEIRAAAGNTNWEALRYRIQQTFDALAAAQAVEVARE